MAEIRPITCFHPEDLKRIATGYTALSRFEGSQTETAQHVQFTLALKALDQPYIKRFTWDDDELLRYEQMVAHGFSFGAHELTQMIAIAIAERQDWNNSLWVWEFHVAEAYRGRGIGRQLMDVVVQKAQTAGLRVIFCETQNTNPAAVHFYQRLGFQTDGLNLPFYPEIVGDEVAIFMKRRLYYKGR